MVANITPDDTMMDAIIKINKEIDTRRTYGVRREEIQKTNKAARCSWSNGSARWNCGPIGGRLTCPGASDKVTALLNEVNRLKDTCNRVDREASYVAMDMVVKQIREENARCKPVKSKVQCLDANEIVVEGIGARKTDSLSTFFNPLPLYSGSFEARERGLFSLKGIEIPPGVARQKLDDLDPQTINALVEKSEEAEE